MIEQNGFERCDRSRRRHGWAWLSSVAIHLAALVLITLPIEEPTHSSKIKTHRLKLIAKGALKNRPNQRKKLVAPIRSEKLPSGAIVDLPPDTKSARPEAARFFSDTNHIVKKETKSRFMQQNYKNSVHERTRRSKPTPETQPLLNEVDSQESSGARGIPNVLTHEFELPELKYTENLRFKPSQQPSSFQNQVFSEKTPKYGRGKKLSLPRGMFAESRKSGNAVPRNRQKQIPVLPQLGVLAAIDGAPANDVADEAIDEGDGTFLNTVQFRYASFFNRLHKEVDKNWKAHREYRKRDPRGNVYGTKTRKTVLEITLDMQGELRNVSIFKSSGLSFLDQEAMAAFRRAQPFPNPPLGLIGDNGVIQFKVGFILYLSRDIPMQLPF